MDEAARLDALPEWCGARLAQVEEWVKAVAWGSAVYGHVLHARLSPELRRRGLPLGAGCRDIGALVLDRSVSQPKAGFAFDDVIHDLLDCDLALETRGRDPGLPIRCVFTHLDYRDGMPRVPLVENEIACFELLGVASPSSERLPQPCDASMCGMLACARAALLSVLDSLGILDIDVPACLAMINQARSEDRDTWPPAVAREVVGTGLFFGYFLSSRSVAHLARLKAVTEHSLQESASNLDLSGSEYWLRALVDQRGYGGVEPVRFSGRDGRERARQANCVLGATLLEAMVCRLGLRVTEGLRDPGSGGYRAFEDAVRNTTFDEGALLRAAQRAHRSRPPGAIGDDVVAEVRSAFARGDHAESEELSALCHAVSAARDAATLHDAQTALHARCREMWATIRERASKIRVRVPIESVGTTFSAAALEDNPGRQTASSEIQQKCVRALRDSCRGAEDRAVYGPVTEDLCGTNARPINWTGVAHALAQRVPQSGDPELLRSRLGIEARKLSQPGVDQAESLRAIKQRAQTVWRGITGRAAQLLGQEFGR